MTYPGRNYFHKVPQETGFLHIVKRIIALQVMLTPLWTLLMDSLIRIVLRVVRKFRPIWGRCRRRSKDPGGIRGGNSRI